jgi:hypothetical protein
MNKVEMSSHPTRSIIEATLIGAAEGAAIGWKVFPAWWGDKVTHLGAMAITTATGAIVGAGTEIAGRIFKKDITVSKNVQTATGEQAVVTETATNVPLIEVPDAWLALKKRANKAAQTPAQPEMA